MLKKNLEFFFIINGMFRLICKNILVGLVNIYREIARKYFIRLSS